MRIQPVYAESVAAVWSYVEGWMIASQIKGRGDSAEELRIKCAAGNGHLMLLATDDQGEAQGVIVLERAGDCLHCTTLAGNVLPWVADLVAEWRKIAAGVGCSRLSLHGRKGWRRVMRQFGFVQLPDGSMEALT